MSTEEFALCRQCDRKTDVWAVYCSRECNLAARNKGRIPPTPDARTTDADRLLMRDARKVVRDACTKLTENEAGGIVYKLVQAGLILHPDEADAYARLAVTAMRYREANSLTDDMEWDDALEDMHVTIAALPRSVRWSVELSAERSAIVRRIAPNVTPTAARGGSGS